MTESQSLAVEFAIPVVVWVVILGFAWRRTRGAPRDRVWAMRGLLAAGALFLAVVVVSAVAPWLGSFIVPALFLAAGVYLIRLPAERATIGGVKWHRNGLIFIVFGALWLIADVARLLGAIR